MAQIMKKYKTLLLSALLFAFTFFALHDYVIECIDKDTQYELCYSKYDKSALDSASMVHATMHAMLDVVVDQAFLLTISTPNEQPLRLEKNFLSCTGIVPQRPPLS
jgi:hypothetical protein